MKTGRKSSNTKEPNKAKNINSLLGILNRRPVSVSGSNANNSGKKNSQSVVFGKKAGRYSSNRVIPRSGNNNSTTMSFAGDNKSQQSQSSLHPKEKYNSANRGGAYYKNDKRSNSSHQISNFNHTSKIDRILKKGLKDVSREGSGSKFLTNIKSRNQN